MVSATVPVTDCIPITHYPEIATEMNISNLLDVGR